MTTVGVGELRQNLSKYLRIVERGERLVVTDRNRPVAELGPPPSGAEAMERLIAEGRIGRPRSRRIPAPLDLAGETYTLSSALDDVRDQR